MKVCVYIFGMPQLPTHANLTRLMFKLVRTMCSANLNSNPGWLGRCPPGSVFLFAVAFKCLCLVTAPPVIYAEMATVPSAGLVVSAAQYLVELI